MTNITFSCTCGRKINVAPQHAGKKAKCPQCGREVLIPVVLIDELEAIGLAIDPFAETVAAPATKPAAPQPARAVPTATPVTAAPVQAQPVQTQPTKPASRSAAPSSPKAHPPTPATGPATPKVQKPAPVAEPEISLPPLIEAAQESAPSAWDLADEPLPELSSENLLPPIMPIASAAIEPLPPLSSLAEEAAQSSSSSPYSHYSPPQTIVRSNGDGAWKDYMWIPCSIVLCAILTFIMQSSSTSFGRSGFPTARTSAWGSGIPSTTPSSPFSNSRTRTLNPGAGQSGTVAPTPFRNPVAKKETPADDNTNVARLAIEKDWSRDARVRTIVSRYTNVDPLTQSKINREFGNNPGAHWDKAPLEKMVLVYRELECLTELAKLVKSKEDLEGLKKAIEHAKTFDFQGNFAGRTDRAIQEVAEKVANNPLYGKFVSTTIAPKVKEAEEKFREAFAQLQKDYGEDATDLVAILPYQLKDDPMLALINDVIKNIPEDAGTKQVLGVVPKTVNEAAKLIEKKKDLEWHAHWDKRSMEWDMHDAVKMFEHCYANAMYVDAENFNQQVFWAPGLKQPAMFLRIGMQLVDKSNDSPIVAPPPGGPRFPPISHDLGEWELDKNMDHMREVAGKIPEQIGQSILDRERRGSCGEWGRNLKDKGFFATPGLFVLRRATSDDESSDMAQRLRLDNLVQLVITQKKDARGKVISGDMQFRLIDVRTKKELYVQPKPMSSVAITGPKGAELIRKELGDLFAYIDTNLLLQDMAPKIEALKKAKVERPEVITKRIQKLVDEKDPYEPLALLVEARCYLENDIATKEELSPIFEKVLGRIKSQQFINGDLGTRHDIMKAFVKD